MVLLLTMTSNGYTGLMLGKRSFSYPSHKASGPLIYFTIDFDFKRQYWIDAR